MALGTQEEQRRFSVFENMVLRNKLEPKGEDVTVVSRRLHYFVPFIVYYCTGWITHNEMCGSNVRNVICIQKPNLEKLVSRPKLGGWSVDGRITLKIVLK